MPYTSTEVNTSTFQKRFCMEALICRYVGSYNINVLSCGILLLLKFKCLNDDVMA